MIGGRPEHIVAFGDDHSVGADTAWGWIASQRWTGWGLDVITVTEPPSAPGSGLVHDPLREYDPDCPRVPPASSGITSVRHVTTAFDPRQVLCEHTPASLTVVGARGRGVLKAMHLGSTAEWLLACPSTPLVIARLAEPVGTTIACVDGSGDAAAMIAVLTAMPWIVGGRVLVLGVREEGGDAHDHVQEAAHRLQVAGAEVLVSELGPDGSVAAADVRDTIMDEISSRRPDLVALGTTGRAGFRRLAVGSVAGTVAHRASCSVLLARDINRM